MFAMVGGLLPLLGTFSSICLVSACTAPNKETNDVSTCSDTTSRTLGGPVYGPRIEARSGRRQNQSLIPDIFDDSDGVTLVHP